MELGLFGTGWEGKGTTKVCHGFTDSNGWYNNTVDVEAGSDLLIATISLRSSVSKGLVRADGEISPCCPALEECEYELGLLVAVTDNGRIIGKLSPYGPCIAIPPQDPSRGKKGVRQGGHQAVEEKVE